MDFFFTLFIAFILLIAIVLFVSFCCFSYVFSVRRIKDQNSDRIPLPEGKIYEPFYEDMTRWILEARELAHEDVSIISHDGLRLTGKFYEYAPGAPIELMFHGYRGSAERDLSGGVQRCFKLGRSALVVEQRCSNTSQGDVITFGIREHQDCLDWIDFVIGHYGADVKIILTGISMGASTVMMAAGRGVPENVIGVLADCGFSSAKEIMYSVMGQLRLPARLCYPIIRFGAKLFGGFDPDSYSSLEAMKTCKVPVIFFHGDVDDFVPCWMSRKNYETCASRKRFVSVPGAGHGLSYPMAPQLYIRELLDFFGPEASHPSFFDQEKN